MNRRLRVILVVTLASVLAVGVAVGGCSGEPEQEGPPVGRIISFLGSSTQGLRLGGLAPDFQFETPEGAVTSLSNLRGKAVLINFWRTQCPPCVYEMPYFQQVYDEWSDKGLVVLAINVGESASTTKSFLQKYEFSLPVLLDTDGEVALGYSIQYFPSTLLVDKDGIIQGGKIGSFQSKEEIEAGIITVIP